MTRTALALAAVLLVAACTSSHKPTSRPATSGTQFPPTDADRPNVVLVVADDFSPSLIAAMPRVQALQRRGMTMDHFFTTSSLSGPARASLMTGLYPHNTGVLANGGAYDAFNAKGDESKSIAVGLRRSGYQTALVGQYLPGYKASDPPAKGWDRWAVSGDAYDGFDYTMRQNSTVKHYGKSKDDYITDVMADRAVYYIKTAAQRGAPFFLQLAPFAPHYPAVPAPRDAKAFTGARYPHTKSYNQPTAAAPAWMKFGPLTSAASAAIDAQYRARLRSVQAVDNLLNRVEKAIAAAGVENNTYIVFTAANGYHMGEYRLPPGKRTALDVDVRVPLIVAGPGIRAGRHAGQYGSLVDLAPTFARLLGVRLTTPPDGISLDAVWHGTRVNIGAQAVLIEHRKGQPFAGDPDRTEPAAADPPDYVAIRTSTGLYVRYPQTKAQEYYNTVFDPYELRNLAAKSIPGAFRRSLLALAKCDGFKQCQAAARLAP